MHRSLLAFAIITAPACAPAPADPDPDPYVQPAPWEELDYDQAIEFMTRLFNPAMRDVFVEYDAETYSGTNCQTCHGPDGESIFYEMPATISPLTLADLPVDEIEDPERLEVALWMEDVVLPAMGRLFEQELTLAGASCTDCHPFDTSQ